MSGGNFGGGGPQGAGGFGNYQGNQSFYFISLLWNHLVAGKYLIY